MQQHNGLNASGNNSNHSQFADERTLPPASHSFYTVIHSKEESVSRDIEGLSIRHKCWLKRVAIYAWKVMVEVQMILFLDVCMLLHSLDIQLESIMRSRSFRECFACIIYLSRYSHNAFLHFFGPILQKVAWDLIKSRWFETIILNSLNPEVNACARTLDPNDLECLFVYSTDFSPLKIIVES
ncbi:hypothetical protein RJ641_009683 [Dillenia turbinata]|uniref:Uncharacterized protein n=1 Tax=Dillenia turbinata TaxID=194707 RepID=A0AAN8V9Q5_9MAGN